MSRISCSKTGMKTKSTEKRVKYMKDFRKWKERGTYKQIEENAYILNTNILSQNINTNIYLWMGKDWTQQVMIQLSMAGQIKFL